MSRFYSKATIQLPMSQEVFTELDLGYEQDFEITIKEFKPYDILTINAKCIPQFAINNKYHSPSTTHIHPHNDDDIAKGSGADATDLIIPGIDHCLLSFKLTLISDNNNNNAISNSNNKSNHRSSSRIIPIKAVLCNGEYDITVTHSHGLQCGKYLLSISIAADDDQESAVDTTLNHHRNIPSSSSHSYNGSYSLPPMSPLSLNKTYATTTIRNSQQVSQALYVSCSISPTVNATSLSSIKPVISTIKSHQTHYYRFISSDPDQLISIKLIPQTKSKHTGYVFNDLDLYVTNRHKSLIAANRSTFVWSNCYSGISQIDICLLYTSDAADE